MISIQTNLINFTKNLSMAQSFFKLFGVTEDSFEFTKDRIFHVPNEPCPGCGKLMVKNGSYVSSSKYYSSQDALFKIGQQFCPKCKRTHTPQKKIASVICGMANDFLESVIVSCSSNGMNNSGIQDHLLNCFGIPLCTGTISTIIDNHVGSIQLAEPIINAKGWYGYDEQYLKENGQKIVRVTILDFNTLEPIFEKTLTKFNKKILMKTLKKVFKGKKPLGFTFDMLPMYPDAFTSVFKGIEIQWCLFHLNQLIFKEVMKACRINRKVFWELEVVHQMYEFFDIHYNRFAALEYIELAKKRLEDFEQYVKGRSKNEKKDIREFEKYLVWEIFKSQRLAKLLRKRTKTTLELRTDEEAKKRIEDLLHRKSTLFKPLQKRIVYINKNMDKFLTHNHFKEAQATNNRLEGYFGRTLSKTDKVRFLSHSEIKKVLKLKKLKRMGVLLIQNFSMKRLALVAIIGLLFAV